MNTDLHPCWSQYLSSAYEGKGLLCYVNSEGPDQLARLCKLTRASLFSDIFYRIQEFYSHTVKALIRLHKRGLIWVYVACLWYRGPFLAMHIMYACIYFDVCINFDYIGHFWHKIHSTFCFVVFILPHSTFYSVVFILPYFPKYFS